MAAQLDTTIVSEPILKESGVDVPALPPVEEIEVVRKADKIGYGVIGCCRDLPRSFRALPTGYRAAVIVVGANGCICGPCIVSATALGFVFGGIVAGLVTGSFAAFSVLCVPVGGLLYVYREDIRDRRCCKADRSKKTVNPGLEEVVTEQPKSVSSEFVPTAPGGLRRGRR
ncbi:MAG: hypothetical protein OXF02_05365 [Simkaniaceae bacterium]|nr:hypothetical protein [Simkaniaceae bacterium]